MSAGPASRLRTLLKTQESSPTSNSTAKRLAHLVALTWLTRGAVGGFFTRRTRIVFRHGTTPLSYRWYYNQTNLITWATNYLSTVTLTNVQGTNTGLYRLGQPLRLCAGRL